MRNPLQLLPLLALLAFLSWSGVAPTVAHAAAPAGEEAPKDQEFNFEGDEVSTDYLKPNTMMVEGLRRGRRSSLISIRLNFVAEIVKSADDI